MKTVLQTFVDRKQDVANNKREVFFRVIRKGQPEKASPYRVLVDVSRAREDVYRYAELMTLKHILLNTTTAGENRTGETLDLHVSSGTIKKTQKRKSANKDMLKHGLFLQIRFSESKIKVLKDCSWCINKEACIDYGEITPRDCIEKPVKSPMGELFLTRHALDRYKERIGILNTDRAWKRLSRLLTLEKWENKVPAHPVRMTGGRKTSETWALNRAKGTPDINIVIVRTQHKNRVVTVFGGEM